MYSINTPRLNIQSCQNCRNKYVEYIGTQAWCKNCEKAVNTIEQQLKVVPRLYQSNNKQKLNSAQIKIKYYITEFCNKFGGIADNEQLQYLFSKAMQLKNNKGINTKNYRQNSAVIVYIHYKDIHKLSIKQFCKKNQLEVKSFNKSYLIYQKIIKTKSQQKINKTFQNHPSQYKKEQYFQKYKRQQLQLELLSQNSNIDSQSRENLKKQNDQLNEQESHHVRQKRFCELNGSPYPDTSFQYAEYGSRQQNSTIQIMIQKASIIKKQLISFLQAVFDKLFYSLLYSQKRSYIVRQLSERILQMYKNINLWKTTALIYNATLLDRIDDSNFYKYLLFLVLKTISFNITQSKYRQTIQNQTGQNLKLSLLKQLIQFYLNNQENLSASGDSMFFIQNSRTTGSQFVKIQEKQS